MVCVNNGCLLYKSMLAGFCCIEWNPKIRGRHCIFIICFVSFGLNLFLFDATKTAFSDFEKCLYVCLVLYIQCNLWSWEAGALWFCYLDDCDVVHFWTCKRLKESAVQSGKMSGKDRQFRSDHVRWNRVFLEEKCDMSICQAKHCGVL